MARRRPRAHTDKPLEERLAEAAKRWSPLPVGLLLEEARLKIESLYEDAAMEAAGPDW